MRNGVQVRTKIKELQFGWPIDQTVYYKLNYNKDSKTGKEYEKQNWHLIYEMSL